MRGVNTGSASLHAGERGAKAMGLTLKVTAYTGKACTPLRIRQVVRYGTLTPAFAGSTPASSAFLGVAQFGSAGDLGSAGYGFDPHRQLCAYVFMMEHTWMLPHTSGNPAPGQFHTLNHASPQMAVW